MKLINDILSPLWVFLSLLVTVLVFLVIPLIILSEFITASLRDHGYILKEGVREYPKAISDAYHEVRQSMPGGPSE